jgi:hypothetical protein
MKKSEIYLFVSIGLFLLTLIIIPVGGFTNSNPYREWYMNGFMVAEINALVSIVVFWRSNVKEKKKHEQNS